VCSCICFLSRYICLYIFIQEQKRPGKQKLFIQTGVLPHLLDLIGVDLALFFDPGYHTILFKVIAAIGFGFIFPGDYKASAKTIGIMGLLILYWH
jgi:hypothetical protein